ncbi:MAG: prepilin-type N-terminal cleavage/methylation domain-containing protein [Gammaproteobacteria bacterium]
MHREGQRRTPRTLDRGFTLIETAIVLLIVGLLLGGLMMPLAMQRERARFTETEGALTEIREALLGHALATGAFPCPAIPASSGMASIAGGGCTRQHGFVPAGTLGLSGRRNEDQLLVDAWNNPYRYSVTNVDADGDGAWDFTAPGEMRDVQIANLAPDLNVCTTSTGSTATACSGATTTLTATAPVVVYSMGSEWAGSGGPDQNENVGATLGGGPSGRNYAVAGDRVFVHRIRSDAPGAEFNDVVTWVSANGTYNRMVRAGQLP